MTDEEEKPSDPPSDPEPAPEPEPVPAEKPSPRAWAPEPIFGTRAAYLLALANGILTPIAFAGIGVWWLELVCWVPLIVALRGQVPRRALGLGWLAGFFQATIGFFWLTNMLKTFSGFPMSLCVLFACILSAYQGGRIALMGWLHARAERRGWHASLVMAAAFAASELVYPLLFPWYSAAAFHEHPLLMQLAELGGPILVSLMAFGVNLALAELLRPRILPPSAAASAGEAPPVRPDRVTIVAGAAGLVLGLVFGDLRIRSVRSLMQRSEPVKIGLAQASISLGDHRRAMIESLRLTDEVKKQGAQFVVWSEAIIPQPFDVKSYEASLETVLGRRIGLPGVVSGVLYDRIPNARPGDKRLARFYNSAFLVDDQFKVKGRYDKQFLLMFGEYLPFGDAFPVLYEISQNSGNFTPGTSFASLKYREHRIAAMICYEDIIPSFVNKLVAEGDPDLMVNLTNDRWFQNQDVGKVAGETDSNEPIQHLALAKLRTIEHRMFLARVSNSGVSAIIDATGEVVVQTETMRQAAVVGDARFMRVATLYSMVGDWPWWAVSALVFVAGFVDAKKKRATSS